MGSEPVVSVIIPTYNRLESLKAAVESVLNQTFGNFELIIADDGSTDETKKYAQEIKDRRVLYLYKENEGLPSLARNFAASRANGTYLAFLDSDDTWRPEKLALQVELMEKRPEIIFCYSQGEGDKAGKKIKVSGVSPFKNGRVFNSLLFRNFIITSSVVLRRSAFLEIGGFSEDRQLVIAEDLKLWLSLAKKGRGFYFSEPLVQYHISNTSVSSDVTKKFNCLYEVITSEMERNNSSFLLKLIVLKTFWLRWFLQVGSHSEKLKEALASAKEKNAGILILSLYRMVLWILKK
ncbi:MAG: glycosyltransferase involved in cell wall biosynthesis [Bacteriovoracaceae bacterium]